MFDRSAAGNQTLTKVLGMYQGGNVFDSCWKSNAFHSALIPRPHTDFSNEAREQPFKEINF